VPPEEPLLVSALLVYASDRTLLSTAARPHGLSWGHRISASLDHAMWLHAQTRFDDWVLYASSSPVARSARGLVHGAMYDRRGTRIASVAQEGLIRIPRPAGRPPS
jgi:acyl-CoA thioesterase-2